MSNPRLPGNFSQDLGELAFRILRSNKLDPDMCKCSNVLDLSKKALTVAYRSWIGSAIFLIYKNISN